MSRGLVEGLPTPHPLGAALPGLYQDDAFAQDLTAAFDDVLAPIIATLDNLHAYVDPDQTPVDFVRWLGQWVGMEVDETWPIERQRQAVARAARIYRHRGTVRGMRELVEVMSGGTVEVVDNGSVGWSSESGKPLPGKATPDLLVRVTVTTPPDLAPADRDSYLEGLLAAVESVVQAAKPAQVPHTVEVVGS